MRIRTIPRRPIRPSKYPRNYERKLIPVVSVPFQLDRLLRSCVSAPKKTNKTEKQTVSERYLLETVDVRSHVFNAYSLFSFQWKKRRPKSMAAVEICGSAGYLRWRELRIWRVCSRSMERYVRRRLSSAQLYASGTLCQTVWSVWSYFESRYSNPIVFAVQTVMSARLISIGTTREFDS